MTQVQMVVAQRYMRVQGSEGKEVLRCVERPIPGKFNSRGYPLQQQMSCPLESEKFPLFLAQLRRLDGKKGVIVRCMVTSSGPDAKDGMKWTDLAGFEQWLTIRDGLDVPAGMEEFCTEPDFDGITDQPRAQDRRLTRVAARHVEPEEEEDGVDTEAVADATI